MVFGEEDCSKLLKAEGKLVEVIWPDVTAELVRPGHTDSYTTPNDRRMDPPAVSVRRMLAIQCQ